MGQGDAGEHEVASDTPSKASFDAAHSASENKKNALFAGLGLLLVLFVFEVPWRTNGSEQGPHASACVADYSDYLKLQNGMSYKTAVRIIGCQGQELARTDTSGLITVQYGWDGSGLSGANMSVMFQGDRMVNKGQFGLR